MNTKNSQIIQNVIKDNNNILLLNVIKDNNNHKVARLYCVTSGAGPRAVGTERGRWSE